MASNVAPLLLLAFHSVPAQQPRAQSAVTMGLVGKEPSLAYRPDCLKPSWACSLHWKPDEGRQKREVGQWVCSPCSRMDLSPALLLVQAAPGPSFLRVPKAPELPSSCKGR